jgi:hypothetical protein
MTQENIKKLYSLIAKDEEALKKLNNVQEKLQNLEIKQYEADALTFKILEPIAQKEGIELALNDINSSSNGGNLQQLGDDELDDVVGGLSRPLAICLTGLLGFSAIGISAGMMSNSGGGGGGGFFSRFASSMSSKAGGLTAHAGDQEGQVKQVEVKMNFTLGGTQYASKSVAGADLSQATNPQTYAQKGVGNCYAQAMLKAIAQNHPDLLEQALTPTADGVNVRLFTNEGGTFKAIHVHVTAVPTSSNGSSPISGSESLADDILTVALTQLSHGDRACTLDAMNFGSAADMLEMLTVKSSAGSSTFSQDANKVFNDIQKNIDAKNPVVANTVKGQQSQAKGQSGENILKTKSGKKIVGSHSYTVLGYNAENKTIQLKNPWGFNPDSPSDGGVIDVTADEFVEVVSSVNFVAL